MRLLIIRHADPDYSIDSLTETGWKEARLLAERLVKEEAEDYYVSPMGRAQDTASFTLKALGREAEICPWLREFSPRILRPDAGGREQIVWDWLPQDMVEVEEFYRYDQWYDPKVMEDGHVKEEYEWVIREFDALLEKHGYRRNGKRYDAIRPNNDTIVFFCHFGLSCVLLSHLLNISPMLLWHGFCAAPASVTTVYTEERREGIASFRVAAYGDTAHLYVHDEQPSVSARFCQCWKNEDERHD